jgi:hypothetical protein
MPDYDSVLDGGVAAWIMEKQRDEIVAREKLATRRRVQR